MSDSDSEDEIKVAQDEYNKVVQREYNRQYYQKNKKRILASVLKKVECPDCKRKVNSQYLRRHQMSSRCVNNDHIRKIVAQVIGTYQK